MDSFGGAYFIDEKAAKVENIFLEFLKSFWLDQNSRELFYESEIEAMRPNESNTMFMMKKMTGVGHLLFFYQ
ncbi:putative DNA helicase [Helianthus anomalus]